MIDLLQQYGVHFVFSGHWHRNGVAHCDKTNITQVITSAVGKQLVCERLLGCIPLLLILLKSPQGDDESGFRIVRVEKDSIEHEYKSLDEMEREATTTK